MLFVMPLLAVVAVAADTEDFEMSPKLKAAVQGVVMLGYCNQYLSAYDHIKIIDGFKKRDDEIERKTGERVLEKVFYEGVEASKDNPPTLQFCEGAIQSTKMLFEEF